MNETLTANSEEEQQSRMLIDINFQNRKIYLAFQEEFLAIIKNYYKSKLDDLDIFDDMNSNRIRVSEKLIKSSMSFLIDKTPNMKNLKSVNDESTPTYRKSFGRAFLSNEKDSDDAHQRSSGSNSKNICFNCDKDNHQLRDCPEPRNMRKINKARNDFGKKNEMRYHDNEEYASMVPGKISDELREALGLRENEIPLHVYKMRLFGYPPAWIEEAKIQSSGLSLFVEKDKKQLESDEDEGEIDDVNRKYKYDVQKIFEFPGFNVQPKNKYVDLYRSLNVPPMIIQHSKEEFIRSLGAEVVNGYKKRKLRDSGAIVNISNNNNNTDASNKLPDETMLIATEMDIANDDDTTMPLGVTVCIQPPLPAENGKPPEPIEELEEGEIDDENRELTDVDMLNEKRKAILNEIGECSAFLDTSAVSTASVGWTTFNESALANDDVVNGTRLDPTIVENTENENLHNTARDIESPSQQQQPATETGHVQNTVYGTPVLPSFSPFGTLPDGDKFMAGVHDVIAFENLAESTGKYRKMKDLLVKVRHFHKSHQE